MNRDQWTPVLIRHCISIQQSTCLSWCISVCGDWQNFPAGLWQVDWGLSGSSLLPSLGSPRVGDPSHQLNATTHMRKRPLRIVFTQIWLWQDPQNSNTPDLHNALPAVKLHVFLGLVNSIDILEPPAFQKYSICWVFQAFFCWTFFYMYFAIQSRPVLTAVLNQLEIFSFFKSLETVFHSCLHHHHLLLQKQEKINNH